MNRILYWIPHQLCNITIIILEHIIKSIQVTTASECEKDANANTNNKTICVQLGMLMKDRNGEYQQIQNFSSNEEKTKERDNIVKYISMFALGLYGVHIQDWKLFVPFVIVMVLSMWDIDHDSLSFKWGKIKRLFNLLKNNHI